MTGATRRSFWPILALTLGGIALLLGTPASSFVPRAERVVAAVAKSNTKGHRTSALRIAMNLRIGDGDVVATCELISHPTGLARLELQTPAGLIERHLMLGTEHRAARNGQLLAAPRAFVPPIFFMQAETEAVLDAALDAFGVDADYVGVAPCGRNDCYVLGDAERATLRERIEVESVVTYTHISDQQEQGEALDVAADAAVGQVVGEVEGNPDGTPIVPGEDYDPPPAPAKDFLAEAHEPEHEPKVEEEIDDEIQAEGELEEQIENVFASVWIDSEAFNLVRIRSSAGVEIEFGPLKGFGKRLSFPKWWTIEEPGKPIVRFEVTHVSSVTAPGGVFKEEWILAPSLPDEVELDYPATP